MMDEDPLNGTIHEWKAGELKNMSSEAKQSIYPTCTEQLEFVDELREDIRSLRYIEEFIS